MKKSIIISASQGIGMVLAAISDLFDVASETLIVKQKAVGEIQKSPTNSSDYIVDVDNFSEIEIKGSFDFIIWSTGIFLHKAFADTTDFEIDALINLHYRVPLKIIRNLHKQQQKPYHLIVIASCSSWRMRRNEAIYCGLCAAKASFTRNFANDLNIDLAGSKVTLINPGGIKTPFFYEEESLNSDCYLNQTDMAKFIWQTVISQNKAFEEIQYLRKSRNNNEPIIDHVTRRAETLNNT